MVGSDMMGPGPPCPAINPGGHSGPGPIMSAYFESIGFVEPFMGHSLDDFARRSVIYLACELVR